MKKQKMVKRVKLLLNLENGIHAAIQNDTWRDAITKNGSV